jgi:HTH-type transcriptional regulator / antitoxin HigA
VEKKGRRLRYVSRSYGMGSDLLKALVRMEIKPIRTEADYEASLRQIEQLLDASPGTPEADRLEVLVTLVEAYEEKHFPIPAPDDPVEVLHYYMESRRGLRRK